MPPAAGSVPISPRDCLGLFSRLLILYLTTAFNQVWEVVTSDSAARDFRKRSGAPADCCCDPPAAGSIVSGQRCNLLWLHTFLKLLPLFLEKRARESEEDKFSLTLWCIGHAAANETFTGMSLLVGQSLMDVPVLGKSRYAHVVQRCHNVYERRVVLPLSEDAHGPQTGLIPAF